MNLKEINNLIQNRKFLERRLKKFEKMRLIREEKINFSEIEGHLQKSESNLKFVKDNLKLNYLDWCVTGCYYALYHTTLALILQKGFLSKNHNATICLLIKYYFPEIEREELRLINKLFIDYQDLLFYTQLKNKRKLFTYSTENHLNSQEVDKLRLDSIKLINKMKEILENGKNKDKRSYN